MVFLKVLNEKSSCGPRSAAKTQAVQAELTKLSGGHAFQWLQTVHNYARSAAKKEEEEEGEIFNNRSCASSILHKQKPMTAFLTLYHLGNNEPKENNNNNKKKKNFSSSDQGLVPKVAGSHEQNARARSVTIG
ncbi:hypothetical protein T10_3243 [Trichinella papuae]|uniref:Uncharacterized protein n=1 Tax=Trichinella papuae TaxID=268474 RepID=A0A0V1MVY5_9BILA|nr:hypothetical protein T10_3243 [Trichinella papuae]